MNHFIHKNRIIEVRNAPGRPNIWATILTDGQESLYWNNWIAPLRMTSKQGQAEQQRGPQIWGWLKKLKWTQIWIWYQIWRCLKYEGSLKYENDLKYEDVLKKKQSKPNKQNKTY